MFIITSFARGRDKTFPTMVCLYDGKDVKFIELYRRNNGLTLYEANQNMNKVVEAFNDNNTIVINDYKQHIQVFGLSPKIHNVYNIHADVRGDNIKEVKKQMLLQIKDHKDCTKENWRSVEARAHIVYDMLEKRGIFNGIEKIYPKYSTDTYSGRSKTTGYNIQGQSDNEFIYHVDSKNRYFVHFDWIAADIRAMSILSGDKDLGDSFIDSDPYTKMAIEVGVDRDKCKVPFLAAMYGLKIEESALDFYPTLKEWMRNKKEEVIANGYAESIMGRRFMVDNERDRTYKSAFNAMIQGSVAHAMQNVIHNICNNGMSDFLVTEVQDSVILACDKSLIKDIIANVSDIMVQPYKGLIDANPRFPLKVSVGTEWKKWAEVKEIR